MKFRKTVSKILALGTGAVMVGATILSATAAADLKNFPSPFVKDGKFNAVLVVGDAAAASDVIGAVDVATSLQFSARVKKTVTGTGGGQVNIGGADAWRVGSGAKKLEFSETLDTTTATMSPRNETVRDVTTFISHDELPNLLASGSFSNSQGDYDYRQYIYFDNNAVQSSPGASMSVVYAEDPDTSKSADYFYVKNGDSFGRYSLEFTESAKSDITDSSGSISSSGTYLWNFEGKTITMLGKDWSIVKARTDAPAAGVHQDVQLTLMGGAVHDVLNEGDSKTYTIGGKDYEVSLDFVGSTSTKMTINGEVTDSLQKGATQTLKDGTQLGVRDILAQDFAGGVRKAEFYLGADKVVLEDTDVGSTARSGEQTLQVGTDTITGTSTVITATNNTNTLTLTNIQVNATADEDAYVAAGGMLSGQLRRPQALLNSWDITYGGLENTPTEMIKLTPSGSTQYYLEFIDGNGKNVRLPLVYTDTGTDLKLGDNDDDLILSESQGISRNDYFLVSDTTQKQGERKTFGLRYISALKSTETSPQIEFQDIGSGDKVTVDYKAATGSTEDATLKIGGGTYKIFNNTVDTSINFDLAIDMNGDGSVTTIANLKTNLNVTTMGGAQILLGYAPLNISNISAGTPGGNVSLSVQTVDTKDYDNLAPSPVEFTISASGGKVDFIEQTANRDLHYVTPSADTNERRLYTSLGAFVDWSTVSNDPDKLVITYPVNGQRLPIVVVSAPGASVSTGEAAEAGKVVYYDYTQIAVGTAKLASEVTNIKSQNAIVVGGPCANAAAAALMGNPTPCYAGFTDGKAMLKLFENGGNVALLVAGASAMDTRRASRVISDYTAWQEKGVLKGTEVEVAGTSFTDITVKAPAPVVPPAPVAPAPAPAPTTP